MGGKPQHNHPIAAAQTVAANDVTSSGRRRSYVGRFSFGVEQWEEGHLVWDAVCFVVSFFFLSAYECAHNKVCG